MPESPTSTNDSRGPRERSRALSPRARFALWVLLAVVALAGPIIASIAGLPVRDDFLIRFDPALAGEMLGLAALFGIGLLLASTPADAIKLPRIASEAIIGAGTAALVWAIAGTPLIALGVGLAGAVALRGRHRLGTERRHGLPAWSPWWGVLLLWHPAVANSILHAMSADAEKGAGRSVMYLVCVGLAWNHCWAPRTTPDAEVPKLRSLDRSAWLLSAVAFIGFRSMGF